MLLDIQGDMNAMQNTMNELEKLSDEEKAEEYYEDNECYSYLSEIEDFEEVFGFVKDRVQKAYLDGLEEGRKEKCLEQNKDGTIRPCEVMKENEELKAEIEDLQSRLDWAQGFLDRDVEYIEICKVVKELKTICDFNCPVHKLATHNACLTCTAIRNSPHHNLKNVTDEELQKIIKDAETEMEM